MGDLGKKNVGRGDFLRAFGAMTAVAVPGCATQHPAATATASSSPAAPYGVLRFFDSSEANTIVAMAECIFPKDDSGPGATDLHVVDFIDRQLAGAYGYAAKMYKAGPWPAPQSSGHGWQTPVLPRDLYRQALVALDAYAQKKYNNAFTALTAEQQNETLSALEKGDVDTFTAFPADTFFAIFLSDVTRGLFSDPQYGGNRDKAGWVFLGFPGDPMAYGDRYGELIDQYDKSYSVAPMALGERAPG